jgi:hypothetical protein
MTRQHIILSVTAYFQILFVSCNVVFIQKQSIIGVILSSFMISLLWTFNVKKVAFGGLVDRLLYAVFACAGAVTGVYLSNWLMRLI